MDFKCNCLGLAAASRVPVKRYNEIVAELLDSEPPPLQGKLDPAVEKQVKKLYEYVDFTPYRAPKVSRRLARRLKKALRKSDWGLAKLIVYTYAYLLERLKPEHALLFAREVLVEPVDLARSKTLAGATSEQLQASSVVGSLLHCSKPEMKVLGTHLLIVFTKVQGSGSYIQQLEGFVSTLCSTTEPKVGAANGTTPRGTKRSSPEMEELLRISSLRALQVHVQFTQRNTYPSRHLKRIVEAVLDTIMTEATNGAVGAAGFLKKMNVTLSKLHVTAPAEVSMLGSFNLEPPTRGSTGTVALEVLDTLGHMAKDPSEGKRVLELLWDYFDVHGLWTMGNSKDLCMSVIQQACNEEQQLYMLYSSLLRHVASTKLSPTARTAVVAKATEVAAAMEVSFATPALVLALRELPAQLPDESSSRSSTDVSGLRQAMLQLPASLARRLGNSQQLMELLGGSLAHQQAQADTVALLECVVAATEGVGQRIAEGSGAACSGLPELLLRELMGLMLSGPVQQRVLVQRLLTILLPSAQGNIKESQVVELLGALYHQVFSASVTAQLMSLSDKLLSSINASCPTPKAAINTCRMTLELQHTAAQGSSSPTGASALASCQVLQLADSSFSRLASQLQCPALLDLRTQSQPLAGLALPNGSIEASEISESQSTQPIGEESKAAQALQGVQSTLQPPDQRRQLLASCLAQSPVLANLLPKKVNAMALEPFVPLSTERLTATPVGSSPKKPVALSKMVSRKIGERSPGTVEKGPEELAVQGVKDFLAAAQQLEAKRDSNIAVPDRAYLKVASQCSMAGNSVSGILQHLDGDLEEVDNVHVVKYLLAADNNNRNVLL